MTGADQQRFIDNLKKALALKTSGAAAAAEDPIARHADIYERNKSIGPRSREALLELLDQVIEESRPINLQVTTHKNMPSVALAIQDLAAIKKTEWGGRKQVAAWQHPVMAELNLSEVLGEIDVPVKFTELKPQGDRDEMRQWIFDSYIGVTSADYCLADSATLVLKTRPGQARSVSLVPSIHIAVIRLEQILADLKELYQVLKSDPEQMKEGLTACMTFITGPSKTADIEATMVHGAHGPREVHLMVVEE